MIFWLFRGWTDEISSVGESLDNNIDRAALVSDSAFLVAVDDATIQNHFLLPKAFALTWKKYH